MHGARLKYLRRDLLCWKWLKYWTKGLNVCELSYICAKWLKYLNKY